MASGFIALSADPEYLLMFPSFMIISFLRLKTSVALATAAAYVFMVFPLALLDPGKVEGGAGAGVGVIQHHFSRG